MITTLWIALACSWFAYFWRTYQWSVQREEIESLKLELDAARNGYHERGVELDDMQTKCEQLTLDLAAVREEAEERAKELDACKEQHAIEERRALQFQKNYRGVLEELKLVLAHWS